MAVSRSVTYRAWYHQNGIPAKVRENDDMLTHFELAGESVDVWGTVQPVGFENHTLERLGYCFPDN